MDWWMMMRRALQVVEEVVRVRVRLFEQCKEMEEEEWEQEENDG